MSVLCLGAIKLVVRMKEFICHLFLLLQSNCVIAILIRATLFFRFSVSLVPHLCFSDSGEIYLFLVNVIFLISALDMVLIIMDGAVTS